MAETKSMKFRLAFREEGEFWNCYLAYADSMKGAKLLGSLLMGIARGHKSRRAFMSLMQEAFSEAVEAVTGKRPDEFKEERAPESERSGHA